MVLARLSHTLTALGIARLVKQRLEEVQWQLLEYTNARIMNIVLKLCIWINAS